MGYALRSEDHLVDGILPFQSYLSIPYPVLHNLVIRQLKPMNTMFLNPYLKNDVHRLGGIGCPSINHGFYFYESSTVDVRNLHGNGKGAHFRFTFPNRLLFSIL